MLDSIKRYIKELPDLEFGEFYQRYICDVQDENLLVEVGSVKTDDIISLNKLIEKLHKSLIT